MSEEAMFRKLAELLLDISGDGGMVPVPAPALAALCERWLAVEDAPTKYVERVVAGGVVWAGVDVGEVAQYGSRVRIIPDAGKEGDDGR
jgi:hypothetical protein